MRKSTQDCVQRVYAKLEGDELQKRQDFSREFPSWATRLTAFWHTGRLSTAEHAQERAKNELMSYGALPPLM